MMCRMNFSASSGVDERPGIAFLLADTQEILGSEREAVFEQIQEFTSIHRNSFLVIVAALHGQEERDLMFSIQLR
ncbi:unnamed protein product [Ranitomeya imitator]|uniref:Uncharacterized protein n=1 Tax=Ranitomeya imitator TaxID=111125 RepID=A0ABN9KSX2_9NEOB|nr:unnamed protein product [Ranitomeya imitator]